MAKLFKIVRTHCEAWECEIEADSLEEAKQILEEGDDEWYKADNWVEDEHWEEHNEEYDEWTPIE